MNVSTNWSQIFDEVGEGDVIRFANNNLSARTFESLSSETRKLVRNFGANKSRILARKALQRRRRMPVNS